MSTGGSNRSNWKFDPKTGERISADSQDNTSQEQAFRTSLPPQEQGAYQPQPQPPTQPYNYTPQPPPTQPVPIYQPQYTPPPTPPAPVKKSNRTPLIAGIVALILVVAVGGGALFLWQNVINRPSVSVERLLPANTLGYFSFDPVLEGQQKAAMDKIREAFEAQPGFKEAWEKLTGQATSALDSSQDRATPDANNLDTLATYLGNTVTVAVLAPDSTDLQRLQDATENGDMGDVSGDIMGKNIVGIIDLDFNPLNKKGPISDLKQQVDNIGKTELVEKYRDVEIRRFITNTQEIYFALLDGSSTAVVGVQATPLKVLIDGFRDNKTLKDDATFKALSGQVPQERIAGLYINLTEIYKQVQLAAPEMFEGGQVFGQQVQDLSGAMLLTLSAANDGMQLDVASETDLSLMGTQVQINPDARPDPSTINDVPSNALAFYAGTDLKTTLEAMLKNLRSDTQVDNAIDQQFQSFEDAAGLSIENDVIPLLGGDYLLSASVDDSSGAAEPVVVFELKLTDVEKTKTLLDNVLAQNPDSNAEVIKVGNDTFYGDESSGVMLGVTQDRFWIVFNPGGSPTDALQSVVDNLGKGFGTSTLWSDAKNHLVRDSNGIGYIDLNGLRTTLENQMVGQMIEQEDYDTNIAPFVRPLKYVLVGSATQSAKNGQFSRNHAVVFIGIGK